MNNIRTLLIVTMVLSSVLLLQPWVVNPQGIAPLVPHECPAGASFDLTVGRCRYHTPPPEPKEQEVKMLPPPPGVIVLKPGNVREQADSCPEGFVEEKGHNDWRFCVDPQNPETIPPMMAPPIAGIPFEKAQEIHLRHVEELANLPGVQSVGLGADAIYVRTNNPDIVPKEVEGVPIKIEPPLKGIPGGINHAINNKVRPLHGAVGIRDSALPGTFVTLTGTALSQGKPWLIFPAHALATCNMPPPCAISGSAPLNQCPHYGSQGQPLMLQPIFSSPEAVGFVQRWTPLSNSIPSADVAAAFREHKTLCAKPQKKEEI